MSDGETYKSAVTTIGGDVFMSLPDDMYIQMPPEKARKLAANLLVKANEAEGKAVPEIVILRSSDGVAI